MNSRYKEDLDILVMEKEEYTGFENYFELGGFVLDLDEDGGFLGLEILEASLKTGLGTSELKEINRLDVNDKEVSL